MLSSGLVLDVRYFGGVAADYSRYKHTITATDVKIGRGKTGAAGIYNSTTSYLDCGNKASIAGFIPIMTADAWCKVVGGENTYRAIISTSTTTHFHFIIGNDNKAFTYFYGPQISVNSTTLFTSANYNKWYHIATVWDGVYGRMYLNGIQEGISAASSGSINVATSNIFIGSGFAGARFFNGTIGLARIWNRALDAVEIKNLYDAYKSAVKNIIV